jgi:hypothetical protein
VKTSFVSIHPSIPLHKDDIKIKIKPNVPQTPPCANVNRPPPAFASPSINPNPATNMETDNEITALRKQIRQLQQQQAAASQTQQQNTANPSTIDQESNTTSIFISTLRLLTFVVYEGNVETLQNS